MKVRGWAVGNQGKPSLSPEDAQQGSWPEHTLEPRLIVSTAKNIEGAATPPTAGSSAESQPRTGRCGVRRGEA